MISWPRANVNTAHYPINYSKIRAKFARWTRLPWAKIGPGIPDHVRRRVPRGAREASLAGTSPWTSCRASGSAARRTSFSRRRRAASSRPRSGSPAGEYPLLCHRRRLQHPVRGRGLPGPHRPQPGPGPEVRTGARRGRQPCRERPYPRLLQYALDDGLGGSRIPGRYPRHRRRGPLSATPGRSGGRSGDVFVRAVFLGDRRE